MTADEKKMKSIWYLVGLMLLSMGAIVTISGVYYLFTPMSTKTALAELHPDLWWGGIMFIAGLIFVLANRNKVRG